jgi:hypothetical protein
MTAINRELPTSTSNTDVEGERRRNNDAPIDDRRTASVDRSENVDESTTG